MIYSFFFSMDSGLSGACNECTSFQQCDQIRGKLSMAINKKYYSYKKLQIQNQLYITEII